MPLLDSLRRGVDVTKFKADQVMRVNRVQNEIIDLRREISGQRDKIATAALQLHKQSALTYPELEELCVAIDQLEARIAEKEAQIAAIRAEVPPQAPPSPAPVYPSPAPTSSAKPLNPCPNCQFDAPVGATFCPNCGKPIPQPAAQPVAAAAVVDVSKCPDCGFSLPASAAFCPNCGKPAAPANPTSG